MSVKRLPDGGARGSTWRVGKRYLRYLRCELDKRSSVAHNYSVLQEPLDQSEARKLIRDIAVGGGVIFSKHALDEMEKDKLISADVTNVLRGGTVEPGELVGGTWRYRVRTGKLYVVVAFQSESRLRIVTAWRKK